MKRIISLVIVLCMVLGTVVSVSATPASSFTRTLNLVRLIRTMFAKNDEGPAIGELDNSILKIYVALDGRADADGTKNDPFATVENARDAIRGISKSGLKGIDVIVGTGIYYITETIEFTAEDAGTEKCPIRYIGEDGAVINGGTSFDCTMFETASGDTLDLFPTEVQDKIYMLDLGKFGYTPEDIAKKLENGKYHLEAGLILVNGKQMDLARYPNADEGWIEIDDGYFLDANGNVTPYTDNDDVAKELQAHQTIIKYGEEHMERVLSWKNYDKLFVRGHYRFIWAKDDTSVTELYTDRDEFIAPYSGGYDPVPRGLLFFYNIPEELDVPGEFYIDRNAVLYYYPEESFETDHFTIPLLNGSLVSITDAEHLIFENLTLETSLGNGIDFSADNLTVKGCKITDIYGRGVGGTGNNFLFTENEVCYIGTMGLSVKGGDEPGLIPSNNLICNNYFHNWSTRGVMNWGIEVSGCGATVCHNEVSDSGDLGLCARGPMNTVEYNYISDTCQFFCDGGTLTTHGNAYGTVVRYNVVMNCGFDSPIDIVGVQGITSDFASGNEFYGNIIYNTTGHSTSVADGRDTYIHNNLCIKPGRTAHEGICRPIAGDVNANVSVERKVESYLLSDIWQSTFPELKGINGLFDPENYASNPMYVAAPANNTYKDNYLFMDKAFSTWKSDSMHHLGKTTKIENHFYTFSEIEEISAQKNNLTIYNSVRNKNPITIAEALAIANEAVGIVMTPEQLSEVGRIGVEYGIGDMLVE